ncbi:MAG: ABC transporter permease [Calditrichaeota bacterium]|nr:ABC transporter permease [Calditrichota bacterium]
MYFKLAWKNIWRNKKRTVIVSASVFFAVILACVMRSAQLGSYSYMIDSAAKMQTGYLQIQGEKFWENRSLDESIQLTSGFQDSLQKINHITSLTPRLEAFALLSKDSITKVSPVIGIDPQKEHNMTELDKKLVSGQYLQSGDQGIIIASGLAKRLKAVLGDSIVLYGSGFHGQIAAAELKITGIVELPLPQMNEAMAFIDLPNAQYIYAAPGRITSLSIMIDNIRNLETVNDAVHGMLTNKLTVMTWDEMMPDLVQSIEMDNASGLIMIGILYMVIAFGVFGTIMMMTAEREKEFGILNSIGMKKQRMIFVSLIESVMISLIGVVFGVLGSIPITAYLKANPIVLSGDSAAAWESLGIEPIMTFSVNPDIYFWQSIIVFVIALFCALYPLLFIGHLKPIQAMRR